MTDEITCKAKSVTTGKSCNRTDINKYGYCGLHGRGSTRPWESTESPWHPDRFRLKKKKKGFSPRFIDPEKAQKWLDEGYVFADAKDYTDEPELLKKLEEGQVDSTLRRGGMPLMEIPEEVLERKRAWIKKRTDNQDAHVQTKKAIEQSKRIERELGQPVNMREEK